MLAKLTKHVQDEVFFHLNQFPRVKAIHEAWVANQAKLSSHFELEENNAVLKTKNSIKKRSYKIIWFELLAMPISLLSGNLMVHILMHLMQYFHCYMLFSYTISHIVSWFSSSVGVKTVRSLIPNMPQRSLWLDLLF